MQIQERAIGDVTILDLNGKITLGEGDGDGEGLGEGVGVGAGAAPRFHFVRP